MQLREAPTLEVLLQILRLEPCAFLIHVDGLRIGNIGIEILVRGSAHAYCQSLVDGCLRGVSQAVFEDFVDDILVAGRIAEECEGVFEASPMKGAREGVFVEGKRLYRDQFFRYLFGWGTHLLSQLR